jgi:hypothetical protein
VKPCQHNTNGEHAWNVLGTCHHIDWAPQGSCEALECAHCGALAHRKLPVFACARRRLPAAELERIRANERAACPVYARLDARTEGIRA